MGWNSEKLNGESIVGNCFYTETVQATMSKLTLLSILLLSLLTACSTRTESTVAEIQPPAQIGSSQASTPPSILITEIATGQSAAPQLQTASTGVLKQIVLESLQKHIRNTEVALALSPESEETAQSQQKANEARFVVRGSAIQRMFPAVSSVTLEAVNAKSGLVLAAAAGRSENLQHAASEAATRLAAEIMSHNLLKAE